LEEKAIPFSYPENQEEIVLEEAPTRKRNEEKKEKQILSGSKGWRKGTVLARE